MSLRRHSSLPSNMSAAWQGKLRSDSCSSFRDDLQLPLPELKELDCTGEDVIEEGESTTDDPVRENHSNVGGVIIEEGDGRLASRNSVTDCSNAKCSAEGNESPRSVLERESGALDSPVQSNVVSDRWGGSHAEQTSTSGREGEAAVFLIDGERYTSISKAANGATAACNSRGCRPLNTSETLGPMFIAGGLGVGVVGGLNSGRVGDFANESGQGEEDYIKLLEVNPGHPLLLRNYARHLFEVRRDYAKAEEYFERAILAGPGDGEVLSQYAKLIWQVYRDEARAGSYFEQAVQSAPDDCYVLAAYASYLWESEDTEQDIEPLQNSAPVYKSAAPVSARRNPFIFKIAILT
ncbi:hypothetical protein O6H91_23G050000 [Diphasiastrum complanatum]|uniref:Uncharacterized protein n=1 Tax=Diphasiastrum complanatum TaxID=34168 RepID=A0ACC2AAH7_DIPCM|nr:hypothetical protein O6H91_23G050000 [Diphasiastrum complanatum]